MSIAEKVLSDLKQEKENLVKKLQETRDKLREEEFINDVLYDIKKGRQGTALSLNAYIVSGYENSEKRIEVLDKEILDLEEHIKALDAQIRHIER